MSTVRTLLMLIFEFPPLGRVSVHRPLMLAKYLPKDGIRPVVVTTDQSSLEAWFEKAADYELLEKIPDDIDVYRIPCPRSRKVPAGRLARKLSHFFAVDEDIGDHWFPNLLRVWDRIVRESAPDALFVTIPPFSMAKLADELARRSGLPLILDFRDNWSQMCNAGRQTWLHYWLVLRQERRCLRSAAAVTGVTNQLIHDLQQAHPQIPRGKFHVVPNGYDGALSAVPVIHDASEKTAPFVIGYMGNFYYTPEARSTVMDPWWRRSPKYWLHYSPRREDWLYRSPYFFFRALKALFDRKPSLRSRVRVRFVGNPSEWLRQQVEHFGLGAVVEHLGPMPHAECLEFQSQCDALLVTSAKVIGGRDYCIAGKTFEYIASGRPIIGFVTPGEQEDFLRQSGMAIVCDADNSAASATALERLIDGPLALTPNERFLSQFHRRETSRQMAALVSKLVAR